MDEQVGHVNRTDALDSCDAYEPYVGHWSRLVAREFLGCLAVLRGGRWLVVGCGTEALVKNTGELATGSPTGLPVPHQSVRFRQSAERNGGSTAAVR
jgi:hypothetical protein